MKVDMRLGCLNQSRDFGFGKDKKNPEDYSGLILKLVR